MDSHCAPWNFWHVIVQMCTINLRVWQKRRFVKFNQMFDFCAITEKYRTALEIEMDMNIKNSVLQQAHVPRAHKIRNMSDKFNWKTSRYTHSWQMLRNSYNTFTSGENPDEFSKTKFENKICCFLCKVWPGFRRKNPDLVGFLRVIWCISTNNCMKFNTMFFQSVYVAPWKVNLINDICN